MARIFGNIDQDLLTALRATMQVSHRSDFCVGYAEETQAYRTLAGALNHLVQRAHIQGLQTQPDEALQPGLFGDQP